MQPTVDGKLRVGGVIQVTRSLGDRKLRQYGLIPEPEVKVHTTEPTDNAIVMASDGLWDVLTPQRVNHVMRNTAKSPDSARSLPRSSPTLIRSAYPPPRSDCQAAGGGGVGRRLRRQRDCQRRLPSRPLLHDVVLLCLCPCGEFGGCGVMCLGAALVTR